MPNNTFKIQQATREGAPVTAAIIGGSGSGKTFTALLLARGLVGKDGKIVVIDTEGKRSLIYADDPEIGSFFHLDFGLPFSSDRYKEAVIESVMADADAIIIDSASHEHEAEGGMVDFAEKEELRLSSQRNKAIMKWIKPKMAHNRFVRYAVGCPAHIIFCIREKSISDVSEEAKNKKPEDRVIYLPVCEKNLIFEMTLALRLEPGTHRATFIKVPKPYEAHIRDGEVLTVKHGEMLVKVASQGKAFDKEYEKQLSICKDIAALGTEKLQLHWQTLSTDIKSRMKDSGDLDVKIKPIASQADLDLAQLENDDQEEDA